MAAPRTLRVLAISALRVVGAVALLAEAAPIGAHVHGGPLQGDSPDSPGGDASSAVPAPPWAEGPLQNDAFLPTDEGFLEQLTKGDAAVAEARRHAAEGRGSDAAKALTRAFEAWFAALQLEGAETASVWVAPPAGAPQRLSEGAAHAVLRRLAGLEAAERSAWSQRFEERAAAALVRAGGSAEALARVEVRHPATAAAARAALAAGDLAMEQGRPVGAGTFWSRAAVHAGLAPPDAALEGAVNRRMRLLEPPAQAPVQAPPQAWELGSGLSPAGGLTWEPPPPPLRSDGGRGVRPGIAFLDDGRVAIQTLLRLQIVTPVEGRAWGRQSFDPDRLLEQAFGDVPGAAAAADEVPGWPLLPGTDGRRLLLVHGRARGENLPNALLCLRPPPVRGRGFPVPTLEWAWLGRRRWSQTAPAGAAPGGVAVETALPAGELEFQPGPVILGSRVLVLAREGREDVRTWLLALELEDGRLAWSRLLVKGSPLLAEGGRHGVVARPPMATQPPALVEATATPRVFAGTHLGAGVLVDAWDGRPVWSLRNRRRDPLAPGWDGGRPPVIRAADGSPLLLWAPSDGDHLYRLQPGPLPPSATGQAPPGGLTGAPDDLPRPIDEAETLLGGQERRFWVHGRSGGSATVSRRGPDLGERQDALFLGPEERFVGRGLVGSERICVASDQGLYLFDQRRELYLLDYEPLPRGSAGLGGVLAARGDALFLVGDSFLWRFRVR